MKPTIITFGFPDSLIREFEHWVVLLRPAQVTLGYDPALRLYQVAGGATTRFAYDGVDAIAEYDGSNALQRRFVFGLGIDQPIVQYEGSGTSDRRFMGSDERGSIISLTDSAGTLLTINRYDEYGKPQATNAGRFQYTGQRWLSEAGLYDYKARDYLPHLGIFAQTDPIGYAGSPNLYAYVLNDPVNLVDPLGRWETPIVITAKIDWSPVWSHNFGMGGAFSGSIGSTAGGASEGGRTGDEIVITATRIHRTPPGALPATPGPSSGACVFAPLSPADEALFKNLKADPIVAASVQSAWQRTLQTGHEWSFLIYAPQGPSILSPLRLFGVGTIREGSANSISPLQDIELRFSPIAPIANFHSQPGTYPNAQYPSDQDSSYNQRTNTLGILITRWGISAGRHCL